LRKFFFVLLIWGIHNLGTCLAFWNAFIFYNTFVRFSSIAFGASRYLGHEKTIIDLPIIDND
jgi:hypothetical protein